VANLRLKALPVGPLQTNAYLLWDPDTTAAVLVDPGDEVDFLLTEIENTGCRLVQLLCTHGHYDHVAAAAAIQAHWNLPLLCHPLDAPLIKNMPAIQTAYGMPPSGVPQMAASLDHAQALGLGSTTLEVRHVPGHSPGHVMFTWGEDALVGDCIFAGSIGRTDLPGGNLDDLVQSIREQIYTLPDSTHLHSGHGPVTKVGREKRSNPFVRGLDL